jgi:cytochrome c biogenesis protein CcdA/thiol-disulfide isomerase/thioredoxin
VNLIQVWLAFAEGLALIVSPCILPVLPLMLAGSVERGRARSYGITLGFVVSFSLFVLVLRQVVGALNISEDILRNVSFALLFVLGLVMFSQTLSQKFAVATQKFADFGARAGNGRGGFGGGLMVGALIGFVWTPCAGPILAAVLVQVIQQKTDLQSVAVTLAFAVGAALPMLAITLMGKELMKRVGFLKKHMESIRKVFAVLILVAVGFMAFGSGVFSSVSLPSFSMPVSQQGGELQDGLVQPYPAPDFAGIEAWINSEPLTMQKLRGKVVLVDFWTYSCINCVRTLPYITSWDKKYRDQGLVIVGVHAPEFEFEKNIDNIKTAVGKYGIQYPVAVDNRLATWVDFKNQYWPAHYLIDRQGNVVYTHFGEGKYDVTENNIRYLLGLKGEADLNAGMPPVLRGETPETYLGYKRADRFVAMSELQKDVVASYMPTKMVQEHTWSLGGVWKVGEEKIVSVDKDSYLRLSFKAKKVFLVMGTADGQPRIVTLKLNGAPLADAEAGKDVFRSTVTVEGHALYELVNQSVSENSELSISADGPGVEMYAFTFGE